MKTALFASIGALLISTNLFAWDRVPTESGDYCKDEVVRFLDKFGPEELEITKIWKDTRSCKDGEGPGICFWVYTDYCRGNIILYVDSVSRDCKIPHYGSRSNMLVPQRTWGTQDCAAVADRIKENWRHN